ncbi:protein of unknown function [Taphrina deformans PYCC 5710]|uniref:DUF803 domain membrane protein n=1 Tax=Taphrina deformans (strain PYCC 5710 / ATCC 11124 / CBS 356.35 / IMI 108563 / JCM 9778 / NBRC 8474) TaxID=1097556 RepID=R4XHX0_TAPDE|nr:protein of unknown function [Taphrina deformans PYCC 5710]|eukprot:CCG84103.1 protein of unknown function [Taphrina deformans PYCC 5710]
MSNTIGCVISILGNVVVSLSLNIQRLAHKKLGHDNNTQEAEDGAESNGNYLRSGWWWSGIVLMAIGETGNFLAYAFAPASVVATLGTTGLIANVFFAPLILKEKFRRIDLVGVAIAIAGGVTVVLSAQAEQPQLDPQEILEAVSQRPFLAYLAVALTLIIGLLYLSPKYGDRYILLDLGLVALFGGFTALSTKGVSSMLSTLFYKALRYPIFWTLLVVLISTAVLQVRYLNRSLANFDSTRVIPCQFCTFTISTIVGSAILYKDFERMSPGTIAMFICGCLLTFLGVWITSYRTDARAESSQDHRNTVNTNRRIQRTISTIFSEQTPLINEVVPSTRPNSRRLKSSNAQTGPLLNYFIAKADNARHLHRGSLDSTAYSSSPHSNGLLRVPRDLILQPSSV